jgi:uncharacterized protein YihD (DUF1040 family)
MRDPNRIEVILEAIKKYWKENPDLRLGQIVTNLAPNTGYDTCFHPNIYYLEDDDFLKSLEKELSKSSDFNASDGQGGN